MSVDGIKTMWIEKGDDMGNEYYDFIKVYVEKLIERSKNQVNNIFVVKHYNSFELKENDLLRIGREYGGKKYSCFYREYHRGEMVDGMDPFLSLIRDMYEKHYSRTPIQEFLDRFQIYSLHRSLFISYIQSGYCQREEDLILSEVEYERELIYGEIIRILVGISKEHPMILGINGLSELSKYALEIFARLLDTPENGRIIVVATFNDLQSVLPHMQDTWENFIKRLENLNCVIDGSLLRKLKKEDTITQFCFSEVDLREYVRKLSNMYCLLEFDQVNYYMNAINKRKEFRRNSIDMETQFEMLRIHALSSVYSENIANALLLCNQLGEMVKDTNVYQMVYEYNYILGLTQVYNVKLNMARLCAEVCYQLAEEQKDAFRMFKAKMLRHMASMSGWHNILFCAKNIAVDGEMLELAGKIGYYNHMAHTYIYAFDNEIDWNRDIVEIQKNLKNFQKGMEIAAKIGNVFLVAEGYRKNIMLSSINGAFHVANDYYERMADLVGDSDLLQAADIKKGLGYNLCAMDRYEEANKQYNLALNIYYRLGMVDFIGECLYNMASNCILAGQYKEAYDYLLMCIRIVEELHLNDLRVCNISKLFGLLGLVSYRQGMFYNCQMYSELTMQFLSHKLCDEDCGNDSIDPSYTACDDDMFLHFYVKGLLLYEQNKNEEAMAAFERAQIYVERSKGYQFFSYVQYYVSRGILCRVMEKKDEAEECFQKAYDFAKSHHAEEKLQMIQAARENRTYQRKQHDLPMENVDLDSIGQMTRQAGTHKDYMELRKEMDFLAVWQKIVDINGKTQGELIRSALDSFVVNFGVDDMVYISCHGEETKCLFHNQNWEISDVKIQQMVSYFLNNHNGFVATKMRKNFKEYTQVLDVFGVNNVCSMIAVPFYEDEVLRDIFVAYIRMKDNWNSATKKYILDDNDYNVFELTLSQLVNAIGLLKKQQEINEINVQLENAAVTDYLTGLLNRDGFFSNIQKLVAQPQKSAKKLDLSVLYIDLDNFKFYNDTYGHDVGDLVLKEIARILMKISNRNGGFAIRFGGDEFLLILKQSDAEFAMSIAREILDDILKKEGFVREISEFLEMEIPKIPKDKQVSCSVGVAPVSNVKDEDDISKAIKRADKALYGIKHTTKCDCKLAED